MISRYLSVCSHICKHFIKILIKIHPHTQTLRIWTRCYCYDHKKKIFCFFNGLLILPQLLQILIGIPAARNNLGVNQRLYIFSLFMHNINFTLRSELILMKYSRSSSVTEPEVWTPQQCQTVLASTYSSTTVTYPIELQHSYTYRHIPVMLCFLLKGTTLRRN